jgi:hypothetical protein
MFVNHRDGVKVNNRADNLEYVTPQQNTDHARRIGLMRPGSLCGSAKLDEDRVSVILALRGEMNQYVVAKLFGVTQPTISHIQLRKSWKHVRAAHVSSLDQSFISKCG